MSFAHTQSRILVGCDLADPAGEALKEGHLRAAAEGGLLGVCHVMPSSGVHMLFPQRYAREAADEAALDERARRAVERAVTHATGRTPGAFQVFIERGTDYAEIVRRAEAWRATLVVVGGRAGGDVPSHFGGVAEKVIRHAHCPVLVVRPRAEAGLVLCATDLSTPSLPAVAAAVAEARLRSAKLVVLHVVDQGLPLSTVSPTEGLTPLVLAPDLLSDIRGLARAEIATVLKKLEAQAESIVVEGHAAFTILHYAGELRPELLVVGAHGRTGLARILLGSVAEHVARAAKTSVLLVRLHP